MVRLIVLSDLPTIVAYRNDEDVARYQDWDLPVAIERFASRPLPVGPLTAGWIGNLAIEVDGRLAGDLYVGVDADGSGAVIGFTLDPSATGRGVATRAAGLVVDRLFAAGLHRVTATCDPENRASMRVLERLGFRHEARTVESAFIRGEWVDDECFALLARDRQEWLERPRTAPEALELIEIAEDNAHLVGRLVTHKSQESFVSPMRLTFRDALYPESIALDYPGESQQRLPVVPWSRAIVADGVVAGFILMAGAPPIGPHNEPYLWRLLVDRRQQGRGIGARAMRSLVDFWHDLGHDTMLTSWVPDLPGTPEPFYRRFGFVPTGDIDDGEVVARWTRPA